MLEEHFVTHFIDFKSLVSPSFLLETPYKELLMSIARGDAKLYSALRKAKLSETVGEDIILELVDLNIITIEHSREAPLRTHPKQKLKKELRTYRIQDKLRFVQPFMRFWFGFVQSYEKELTLGNGARFLENFKQHHEGLCSLVYEQLSNDLLKEYYKDSDVILSFGSHWDLHSEFDILAVTKSGKTILGECKYKERKICKNELTKLQQKAIQSGIKVDVFVLFSKSGFSKELLSMCSDTLLLFELDDLHRLIR